MRKIRRFRSLSQLATLRENSQSRVRTVVDPESNETSNLPTDFIHSDELTSNRRRCNFRDVEWCEVRCSTDSESCYYTSPKNWSQSASAISSEHLEEAGEASQERNLIAREKVDRERYSRLRHQDRRRQTRLEDPFYDRAFDREGNQEENRRNILPLFVKNGKTTTRESANDLFETEERRERLTVGRDDVGRDSCKLLCGLVLESQTEFFFERSERD